MKNIGAVTLIIGLASAGIGAGATEAEMKEGKTVKVQSQQADQVARDIFVERMHKAFLRDVPKFGELPEDIRKLFLKECIPTAAEKGLTTEQGIAAYALAVLYLGIDFETASTELQALLKSDYPEVRKVHAMNEWVEAMIGDPKNVAAADKKLKQALQVTEPWGR